MDFYFDSNSNLQSFASIAQVSIALINIGFAFYIFIYQRNQNELRHREKLIHEQKITKLSGFREYILKPNITSINDIYNEIDYKFNTLKSSIDKLTNDDKISLNEEIKNLARQLRSKFYGIKDFNSALYKILEANLDSLIDSISNYTFADDTNTIIPEDLVQCSKNQFYLAIVGYDGA